MAQFISFHELHSFLLSCFFFLVIWASMCCQCIQEWELIGEKEMIYAFGGQWVLCWGYSITEHHILNRKCRSYIYLCFWKENLNKDGYFFHLFHFLSPSLLGYSWCSLAGQNVWVSISNRALMSITSPGVSPKIHTFCQGSGIGGGWNGAMAGGRERSEEEVFKATGRPFPRGSVAGRQAFSSDPSQLSLKLK